MKLRGKETFKDILGEIPWTAELYWLVRQRGKPLSRFSLKYLQNALPDLVSQALPQAKAAAPGKRVFIFATLHYWIEQAALLGLALAGQGHQVTLVYLPYSEWHKPVNRFDLRRQSIYARKVLGQAEPLLKVVSLFDIHPGSQSLPASLLASVNQVTAYDVQYTLQVEEVDTDSEIYQLRAKRNRTAAHALYEWLNHHRPDVVVIPNGSIIEMGVAYRVARNLKIPTVTYEYSDQRERIWIAQNSEVMRQETDNLWRARQDQPLSPDQIEKLAALFSARRKGEVWENFARLWQGVPDQGGEGARAALGLDGRPVILLATNVLGDSLTLGRQVFSQSMAEWIVRSVQYFSGCPDTQLVVRIHPGEVLTHGPSMVNVIHEVLPRLPEHIRLIGPREKINTYDLIEVADLGLVYTTTVGLEMALSGVPVIVAGQTHYRGRGFTIDPDSWVNYFKQMGQVIANPKENRLTKEQVEKAWRYAYNFFFEYPQPFPWHLNKMWEDVSNRPMAEVLGPEGQDKYGDTFAYLVGKSIDWSKIEAPDPGVSNNGSKELDTSGAGK